MLRLPEDREGRVTMQISVCDVASGRLTESRRCQVMPMRGVLDAEDTWTMLVSSTAHAVLVPESQQAVSLCQLPSLDVVAQLVGPAVAGAPATLVSVAWAAHGSLVAILWHAADLNVTLTVHSGFDGTLLRTLWLGQHAPEMKDSFHTLAACSSQPFAAVIWSSQELIHVVLMDLATGTHRFLRRPAADSPGDSYSKKGMEHEEYEIYWAPQGQHLVVSKTLFHTEHPTLQVDCSIFAAPSGEWRGLMSQHGYISPNAAPIWSSQGNLCLGGDQATLLDLSAKAPVKLQLFNAPANDSPTRFSRNQWAFAPGAQHLVQFEYRSGISPITHWVYAASAKTCVRHEVLGISQKPFCHRRTVWHPTFKRRPIYACAVADPERSCAVYLIDAARHRLLTTWTPQQLAGMLQSSVPQGPPSLAWSADGKKLAIANRFGTIILNFGCVEGV